MFQSPLTNRIVEFLSAIGVEVIPTDLESDGFLPGILVDKGKLFVDESKLTYPGDLLHEAGHLAIAPSAARANLKGEVVIPGADMDAVEVQVTAWAYAAIVYLRLDPRILFHDGGYHGKSKRLIITYTAGVYPGVHGLQTAGMTTAGEDARKLGVAPYPHMLKWVRD